MKSVILHIEYLIQRSDCVIIPGVGALVAEHIPARISESEGVIYPPMRAISFNAAIRHDDGMLATSIARAEGILFEDARMKMAEMINSLIADIHHQGEVALGNIGRLYLDADDELHLEAYRSASARSADCGMMPAPLSSRSLTEEKKNDSGCDENQISDADSQIANEGSEELADLGPDMEWRACSKKNYYIPVNKIFARCAASLVVLPLIALSFILPRRQQIPNRVEASLNPVETLMTTTGNHRAASAMSENDTKGNLNSSVAQEGSDAPSEEVSDDELIERNYLIVATFATDNEAEKFIAANAECDYTLKVVKGRNVWRISAGQGDISTLRSLMNSSDFKKTFTEAWIWSDNK